MKALTIIICFIFTSGCLKAKKSPFDLSSPSGFGGFFFLSQNSQQGIGTGTSTGTGTGSTTTSFSVSGSISGFTAGSLILQNNAANDLTLTATNTYSFTGLASGSTYAITIKTNPTGFVCSIVNASGTITANVTNANITCAVMTVNPAYTTNGLKWNDYINRDFSKDIFSQADTACNTANTGGYRTCVHAGEIRKFDIPSRSTCTGLTATDNLSALNWICKTNSTTGGVSFYSSGLKKGKYLSDLIDWTNNVWQSLTITVKDGTTTLAVSNPLKFWTNIIDVSGTITPNTSGNIYLYDLSTLANSITISANKVSLVINPTGIKSVRTIGSCNVVAGIDISNKTFTWMEGSFDFGNSTQNAYGVLLSATKFSVLKNIKIQNAGMNCVAAGNINNAINLNTATNNYLEDIVLSQTLGTSPANGNGLFLSASDDNLVSGISISNMATDGIQITSSKGNTILNTTVISSAAECVLIQTNSHNNSFLNISTANTNNYGIRYTNSNNALFTNVVVFNHQNHGIDLISGSSLTVHNIAASNNPTGHVNLNLSASYFTGIVKTSTATCIYTASSGGMNASCVPVSPSDFTAPLNIASISNTFVGYSATDSKNSTPSLSGNANGVALGSMTDWVRFDHLYKGIGKYNSASFPSALHLGVCNSGNCTIWDLSLKSTDTVLRNANLASIGAACPSSSNMITHTYTGNTVIFLRNSIELLNDGVGNDNGLCEANEDCLLTPNIGAYQGHGNLVSSSTLSGGCADVTTQGIKLYQYDTNGY
jgi:hypothetical protein